MDNRNQQPLLTVAVTTYNRWSGCRAAIEALVRNRDARVDLVVVDDCSDTLAPKDLHALFAQHDVRYYRHDINSGLAAARNTAINAAAGTFFSFCDDDDVWTNDMMPRFLEACEDSGEEVGVIIGYPKRRARSCSILHDTRPLFQLMVAGMTPPVAAQVYRVSYLRRVGGYREKVLSGVDHDIWISLASTGCHCKTLFDVTPRIDANLLADRMTTNEAKRRERVENTLDIWEPEVTRVFGVAFAQHLRSCYQKHLDYGFFKKSVAERKIVEVFRRMMRCGVAGSLTRDLGRKAGLIKYCGAFAAFHGEVTGRSPSQYPGTDTSAARTQALGG